MAVVKEKKEFVEVLLKQKYAGSMYAMYVKLANSRLLATIGPLGVSCLEKV